ncbi:MAG: GlxA family transcriptional regulator [Lysobacterales bacterium]
MLSKTRSIAVFIYPGGQSLDITGPLEVFNVANFEHAERHPNDDPPYSLSLVAAQAGPVKMASGIVMMAERGYAQLSEPPDTLLVSGGMGDAIEPVCREEDFLAWLRNQSTRVRRMGSVCSGALILARAGILDQRRATTHWRDIEVLGQSQKIHVQPDAIYARDEHVWTSAGITAGMDMALAMVAEDHGMALALSVAKRMVMVAKRSGGQSQFSQQLINQEGTDEFADLAAWLQQHLNQPHTMAGLAERLHMSERHFRRRFVEAFDCTPQKFLESLRLEAAKPWLENTSRSLKQIAYDCGFSSEDAMRRVFKRRLGINPAEYRERFGPLDTQ